MRHRKHTFKVGRPQGHRVSLLRNLVRSLFYEERIVTTVTKAKEARRMAEKMITLAKDGSLHARRRAISAMGEAPVVHYLFEELVDSFRGRNGGYTRIVRLGQRRGDAAEMCILQLVEAAEMPEVTSGAPAETREQPSAPSAAERPAEDADEESAETSRNEDSGEDT